MGLYLFKLLFICNFEEIIIKWVVFINILEFFCLLSIKMCEKFFYFIYFYIYNFYYKDKIKLNYILEGNKDEK